jgi:hypothetical protein
MGSMLGRSLRLERDGHLACSLSSHEFDDCLLLMDQRKIDQSLVDTLSLNDARDLSLETLRVQPVQLLRSDVGVVLEVVLVQPQTQCLQVLLLEQQPHDVLKHCCQ